MAIGTRGPYLADGPTGESHGHAPRNDTIPLAEKKRRNNVMLKHQQAISRRHHEAMVGSELEVIVEGAAKIDPKARADGLVSIGKPKQRTRLSGRTRGDHIVAFDGAEDLVGQLVKVKVTEGRELSLSGELVDSTHARSGSLRERTR